MKKLALLACSALLILAGCSSKNAVEEGEAISIASAATTESAITAYMVKGMIEHYNDQDVKMINNLGTGVTLHQAMVNGDANISTARYTGTDLIGVLQEAPMKDPKKVTDKVQKLMSERFQQHYFNSYGFENTYAFMVREETAKKYDLKKVSDLKKIADQVKVGIDTSWMTREGDGYKAFAKEYGFKFSEIYPMQIGLVYDALEAGKMDVILGYTTDGRISSYNLVTLQDDRQFFPPYDATLIATDALLKAQPEVKETLEKLEGKISTEQMQKLNYEADNDLVEPAVVAERFLEEHNYFEGGE